MILTNKQQEGLNIAVSRYRLGEKYTCISGYAGSGKSTLVRFIIDALEVDEEDVAYVAFTGKASNVLKQKGCPNATTAHKLLYWAKPTKDGKFIFTEKESLDHQYKVIVVDEVSMLPKIMWDLLLSHGVYILACGDPFQLPPIDKTQDNHVLDTPHIFLDEIMRQAKESEIIRLSMHIREGLPLQNFIANGEQVQVVDKSKVVTGMFLWADQILCATNDKRHNINNLVRQLKGFGDEPQPNDKIICARNNWDIFGTCGSPLTNGAIGRCETFERSMISTPYYMKCGPIPIAYVDLITDEGEVFSGLEIDYTALTTGRKFLTPQQEYQLSKAKMYGDPPMEFAYGYAITTHRAQGSEWNKVLVFEERFPFDKTEHARWLYTACTRASEKLVVIKQ